MCPASGSSSRRSGRVDPARRAAYDLLVAVRERNAYANLLWPRLLRERGLPVGQRAFATELAYGTLRMQGSLDLAIDRFSARAVDPAVRDALRLGAYQLWQTRVPAHAAVDSTVELVRAVAPRAAGFANAVLRRLAAHPEPPALSVADDPAGHLAVVTAHPRWVVEAFFAALGGDWDETRAALAADNVAPEVQLVARRLPRDELLAAAGEAAQPGRWSPYAVRLVGGGDPGRLASVRDGRAAVQDEGSQLVALALAAAEGPGRGVVDLAAGPGGKAALLAAVGLDVLGVELHPPRARLVAQAGVPVVVADGRRPPVAPGSVDRVLLDAPCTGLGALRRRPEARWRRSPSDVPALARLQQELLTSAVRLVRPGGLVLYATCSPHLVETREVVAAVLRDVPEVGPVDVRTLLPAGMPALGDGPFVQLWPHRHGTDAMFLALLRRR